MKETETTKNVVAGVQVKEKVLLHDVTVRINDTVVVIDSLDLENEKTILLKQVKGGTEVSITNSDPIFKTVDVDALMVPKKKKWYNSKAFKAVIFAVGFITGFSITK